MKPQVAMIFALVGGVLFGWLIIVAVEASTPQKPLQAPVQAIPEVTTEQKVLLELTLIRKLLEQEKKDREVLKDWTLPVVRG